jgi:hypothetical protein
MSARARQGGPVGSATLWMVVLSVLLFWLPTLGPWSPGWSAEGRLEESDLHWALP